MSKAHTAFRNQVSLVDNLIHINRIAFKNASEEDLNSLPFKRKYYALSQAVVVFSVAAWQAYVENVIREIYQEIRLSINTNSSDDNFWMNQVFNLNFNSTESRIEGFSTPNSRKVIKLFRDCLGFDPSEHWKWENKKWKGKNVHQITDFWLKVRHASAHGSDLPEDIASGPNKGRTVNLDYYTLLDCKRHFMMLAKHTDRGITLHAKTEFGVILAPSTITLVNKMREHNEAAGPTRRLVRRKNEVSGAKRRIVRRKLA